MRRKMFLEFVYWFAHNDRPFDMGQGCCCVAGHLEQWLLPEIAMDDLLYLDGSKLLARTFLISEDDAEDIFLASNGGDTLIEDMAAITRVQAVAVLRRYARTGIVDFSYYGPDGERVKLL